jgi:hypothetical protein
MKCYAQDLSPSFDLDGQARSLRRHDDYAPVLLVCGSDKATARSWPPTPRSANHYDCVLRKPCGNRVLAVATKQDMYSHCSPAIRRKLAELTFSELTGDWRALNWQGKRDDYRHEQNQLCIEVSRELARDVQAGLCGSPTRKDYVNMNRRGVDCRN